MFDTKQDKKAYFYIFNTKDVEKFDNINLPTYQITDNQKTSLLTRNDGTVLTEGKTHSYSCFNERFYNDWNALEMIY